MNNVAYGLQKFNKLTYLLVPQIRPLADIVHSKYYLLTLLLAL